MCSEQAHPLTMIGRINATSSSADDVVRHSDMAEPDSVNHPSHYTWLGGIEVIQVTEHLGFCLGNVVKYVLRADHKGQAIEDLRKAAWYLAREIERRGI